MENYSLLMGDSSGDEDGGGVDGGAFRGHFPVPAACEQRLLSPGSWLRDGGGSGSLQDSINPKPLSEGIAEEHPRHRQFDIQHLNQVLPRQRHIGFPDSAVTHSGYPYPR
ncbi:hypothetical protein QYE76_055118 [Lolium multiflorum]|uniref:Uncharacterized protein n=1 Tax=Lolium multiflorum TaxID=4521 RepID=A0AAD8T056_LOLMU|nr:hypothetical protein QYE76_055118 [Lolium multiflorum]